MFHSWSCPCSSITHRVFQLLAYIVPVFLVKLFLDSSLLQSPSFPLTQSPDNISGVFEMVYATSDGGFLGSIAIVNVVLDGMNVLIGKSGRFCSEQVGPSNDRFSSEMPILFAIGDVATPEVKGVLEDRVLFGIFTQMEMADELKGEPRDVGEIAGGGHGRKPGASIT
ncbi:unnamed protein product [Lactuca saligna]|uniref:Uncharacterized protein n=1 Tax=Lactuca saligna TaxID=75948 RepID=A0AA36EMI9_LACSI|nr:unnamed protein product [Lactuca saligna]